MPFPGVVEETDSFGTSRDAVRVLLGEKNIESKVDIVPATEPRWRMREARRAPGAASHTVLIVAGTRPECIKLAPVIDAIAERDDIGAVVVNSGQHADAIVATATAMLAAPRRAALPFNQHAPFGAGDAAQRIVAMLAALLADAVAA